MANNIILVKGSTENLDFVTDVIGEADFNIVICPKEHIFDKAKTHKVDLILMTMKMALQNHHEVCKKLKYHSKTKNIPVIILFNKNRDKFANLVKMNNYLDDYICFPANRYHILTKIQILFNLKRLNDRLLNSEKTYRTLVENTPDLIFQFDRNGTLLFLNKRIKDLFGHSPRYFYNHPAQLFDYIHPEDLAQAKNTFEELVSGRLGSINNQEIRVLDKNNKVVWLSFNIMLVSDELNNNEFFQGVARDVSRQKLLLVELQQSEKLAAIGELVAGVSHELNNPLTTISGFSELLLQSNCPENIKEDVQKIFHESQRCKKIVQNLLTFSRKHRPERKWVDINTILMQTLDLKSFDLKKDDIQTYFNPFPNLPFVLADEHQLQQAFLNIINNSHQALAVAGKKGAIYITTSSDKDIVSISFRDTGPGIPKEHMNRIFDPFFTTKEVGKGTGLGLSIVYGIITEHDGKLRVESIEGKGTEFVVELPISEECLSSSNI